MRIDELISEDISRRNFVRGVGAAIAAPVATRVAAAEPGEEDVFWGARKDYVEAPRKLYPNTVVNRPDQYVEAMGVVIYSRGVYNKMNFQDFLKLKADPNIDTETVPANTVPGINEPMVITQLGDDTYNYFATQSSMLKFAKQYQAYQLSRQGQDTKQKMARGDWSSSNISKKELPPGNMFDRGSIERPKMPWEISQTRKS